VLRSTLGSPRSGLARAWFNKPTLPRFLNEVVVRRLVFGGAKLDIRVARHDSDVSVNVLKREGDAQVIDAT
jgi:hypothetical protein